MLLFSGRRCLDKTHNQGKILVNQKHYYTNIIIIIIIEPAERGKFLSSSSAKTRNYDNGQMFSFYKLSI